ncbi:MAG: AmmeMemoRadiSam system protein B, partial [Acidobacteria bacterium]
MTAQPVPLRRPAVAGSWYPGTAEALSAEVDTYLARAGKPLPRGSVIGLVAPHAGLMYSGPVAAWAYRSVQSDPLDVVVLVGPSHRLAFDGVAMFPRGGWDTPLGPATIAEEIASAIGSGTAVVHESESAHAREHSLEMQLPFL